MRLSTAQIYALGSDAVSRTQSELFANQQRIALGRRIVTPSDDPVGAAEAVVTSQSRARVTEFQANIVAAGQRLSLQESILGDVSGELADIHTLAVNAGAPTLTPSDRASLATELEQRLEHLVSLANSRGADDAYVFSGYRIDTPAFANVAGTYQYQGDAGRRMLTVSSGRTVAINQTGAGIFDGIAAGNGTFEARADAANTGSGLLGASSVASAAALTGNDYRLQFSVAGGVTTYAVYDLTVDPLTPASVGNPYSPGQSIVVGGMQVSVSGSPATGDAFTITTGARQSVFVTVQELIDTLRTPVTDTGTNTRIANGVGLALQNLGHAQESVLTARAEAGAVLRELDVLSAGNDALALQYDGTLSRLQDLDYNQALSDFARQQVALEAAQKSFASLSRLSLFNYL